MKNNQRIPWLRIGAESVAIVVSILLAFGIEAWWQRRSEIEQADTLVASLYTDFQTSQAELQRALNEHQRYQLGAEQLLDTLASAELGAEINVSMGSILGSILAPTYSPTDSALELAFLSGQIDLIEDSELRNLLASWRQLVPDTAEEQLEIGETASTRLIPEFSKQVRFGRSLNSNTMDNIGTRDEGSVRLRPTSEIEGALAYRVFLGNFVVQELAELGDMQTEIIRRLEQRVRE